MLELYHHGTSVCAAKARIALGEKGLDWVGHSTSIPALLKYVPPGLGEMMGKYGREAWPKVKAIVQ